MASDYKILTLKEVSQMLQVHPTTLYKLIRKGKLPPFEWTATGVFEQTF